eukprot:c21284_g1_i2 orf=2-289(-)
MHSTSSTATENLEFIRVPRHLLADCPDWNNSSNALAQTVGQEVIKIPQSVTVTDSTLQANKFLLIGLNISQQESMNPSICIPSLHVNCFSFLLHLK